LHTLPSLLAKDVSILDIASQFVKQQIPSDKGGSMAGMAVIASGTLINFALE